MENITVGQISAIVIFIAALITGGIKIKDAVKKWLENLLKGKFDEQSKKIDDLSSKIDKLEAKTDEVDFENCKNYLVTYISSIKRGEGKDEIEKERFWENYKRYTDDYDGNSYIKGEVKKLTEKGLI